MKKKKNSDSGIHSEINALNVGAKLFAQHFEFEPPAHLGMGLILLVPNNTDPHLGLPLMEVIISLGKAAVELLDVDQFFQEFMPKGVDKVTVEHMVIEVPNDLFRPSNTFIARPSVVFFDGNRKLNALEMRGLGCAMRAIERLAIASGSFEPKNQQTMKIGSRAANEYRESVGNLYSRGAGVWCRDLVPYYYAWRSGMMAFLEGGPFVATMRESMANTPTPTELQYSPSQPETAIVVVG